MKICLISQEYPPETGFGGIGTYTYNLAQGLTEVGHDVSVITRAVDKEKIYRDKKVRVYRIFDKKVPFRGFTKIFNLLTNRGFAHYWHSRSVFKKIEEIVEKEGKFDVIEGSLWDGECVAYSKKINIPLVVRIQTPIFKSREILGKPPKKVLEFIEKTSLQKAVLVASISKNIAKVVGEHYGISKNKFNLAVLGVQLPKIKKAVFKKNCFKLLYVGRLEKRKGTEEFIIAIPEILKRDPRIMIDIIGNDCYQAPGETSYLDFFKKIVPLKLQKKVKFHGYVENKKLAKFYRECGVFIAPSRYESFGLIFIEAMAWGKPVIGTLGGAIPETVKNGKTGILVEVDNPKQISEAVLKVFGDEKLRERLGKNAFEHVRENFTVEKMVKQTLKIYNSSITKFNHEQPV